MEIIVTKLYFFVTMLFYLIQQKSILYDDFFSVLAS
jgi:hypothetical protein